MKFKTDLTTRLIQDGYIAGPDTPIEITRKNNRWVVNGTPIADNKESRYCGLFERAQIHKTDKARIVINKDVFMIVSSSEDGQSGNKLNIQVDTKTSGGSHHSKIKAEGAAFQNPTTGTWMSYPFETAP